MAAVTVLTLIAIVTPALTVSLPPYLKACKRDSPDLSKCFFDSLQAAIPNVLSGDKTYDIPALDPFTVDELEFKDSGNSKTASLSTKYNNVKLKGLKNLRFGPDCKVDLENKKLIAKLTVPEVDIKGLYDISGKILSLPIQGEGDFTCELADIDIEYIADITVQKGPDGKEHLQLVNPTVEVNPQKFNIELKNLFNGDETLGDTMNNFLNDNWQEAFKEFGPAIKETCAKVINPFLNSIASNIPYDELFPK